MAFNPDIHRRQSIRIANHNYSQPDAYFITVCTHQRANLFGEIIDGNIVLNDVGRIAQNCWREISEHFPVVMVDEFIIMPNHVHGIIVINECRGTACRAQDKDAKCPGTACRAQDKDAKCPGTACRAPTVEQFGKPISGSIATIIRSFKSASTKSINIWRNTPGIPVWQRNYWERIIRNEREMQLVCQYIRNNPTQWQHDDLNNA